MDAVSVLLRLLLLSSTAVVAGTSLMRPLAGSAGSGTRLLSWVAGSVAAVAALLSIPLTEAGVPFAVAHAVLALVLPALLRFPSLSSMLGSVLGLLLLAETTVDGSASGFLVDLLFTSAALAWLGMAALAERGAGARRAAPLIMTVAFALAAAGVGRLVASGIAFDRRLYESGYGLILLLIAVVSVALAAATILLRQREPWRVYRAGAVAVVAVLLSTAALPALARPPDLPVPGIPLLAHGSIADRPLPVLVSPQRPGKNLVHFPESAGGGLTVRAGGPAVPAVPRSGATGTWAEIDLPPERGDLVIERGTDRHTVRVDTGAEAGPASAVGRDGPECAGAALGSLVAGARPVLSECPSDALSGEDADALRRLAGFVGDNGAESVAVVADDSTRSRRAADILRSVRPDITVNSPPRPADAVIVVSGWDSAGRWLDRMRRQDSALTAYPHGIYLAPWLLHGPMLDKVASSFAPLRFDPRDNRSLEYGMTLASEFGGELPSVSGFRRWLSARDQEVTGPVAVYASAQVDVMKMRMPGMADRTMHGSAPAGQWNPSSTIVAISGALPS